MSMEIPRTNGKDEERVSEVDEMAITVSKRLKAINEEANALGVKPTKDFLEIVEDVFNENNVPIQFHAERYDARSNKIRKTKQRQGDNGKWRFRYGNNRSTRKISLEY
jgi:uncharacterized Fe-S radical SAM superfamily protein PflX